LNEPADNVTVQVWTPANRLVYENTVPGPFSIGMVTVTLDLPQLDLANGLFYVIVKLPDGSQAIGKLVTTY
jgi:hypothetical protein